jgi:hypothetical protein
MTRGTRSNGPDHASVSVVKIDSDARDLRESLKRISGLWRRLEPGTAQRVRFLLTEVVSRIADPRRAGGPISVRLDLLPAFVRIEISGPGLRSAPDAAGIDDLQFPIWVIEDLAERWGSGPGEDAIWFELDRGPRPLTDP